MPSETEPGDPPDVGGATPAEELLLRAGHGDQGAFGQLYDLLAPKVFGLIRRLVVNQAQSEEVTQEVFLQIWQTASRFDPNKGKATAWAMTIAHRRAVDRIRSAQAEYNRDVRVGIRDRGPEYDHVAEQVEIHVEHEKVQEAMRNLSDRQREAVSLAYYGGYTHTEIAGRLSIPVGTVKTRLRDGMIRLRQQLGAEP